MPGDPRDYKLDLSSGASADPAPSPTGPGAGARPYLSVHFQCCGAYQRVYRSAHGTCYQGRCPRCGKPVRFPVGQQGTTCRFFVVR